MTVETARIDMVGFLQLVCHTRTLCEIPIRQMHMCVLLFGLLVDVPAHDAHLCCISKAFRRVFDLMLLVRSMGLMPQVQIWKPCERECYYRQFSML